MNDALALLEQLDQKDIDTLFQLGREQTCSPDEVILREEEDCEDVFIILDGLLGVTLESHGTEFVALIGSGDIVGEMSLLEPAPASATVTVIEDSLLLSLNKQSLMECLDQEPKFAQRLFRALAIIANQRLRDEVGSFSKKLNLKSIKEGAREQIVSQLQEVLDKFKDTADQINQHGNTYGAVPDAQVEHFLQVANNLSFRVLEIIGDKSQLPPVVKSFLGQKIKTELLPYFLLSRTAERICSKPREKSMDFQAIEWIYQNEPTGPGHLGPLIDQWILELPFAQVLRDRKELVANRVSELLENIAAPSNLLTLTSGPARELFEVFRSIDTPESIFATMVDTDQRALDFVSKWSKESGLEGQIRLEHGNLVYLATGFQQLDIDQQDMVYSVGLIDQFNDKFAVLLLNYIYDLLEQNGRVLLSCFDPSNPSKPLMEHVFDWEVHHRSKEQIHYLFAQSNFDVTKLQIHPSNNGTNLLVECLK